jgi:hypothetical protein
VSAAPVDFPDWRVVVVTTDITARKRAEAQRAYKNEPANLFSGRRSGADACRIETRVPVVSRSPERP